MGKAKDIYTSFLVRYCVVIVVMLLGALMFQVIENGGITRNEQKLTLVRDRIKTDMEDLRRNLSKTLNVSIESAIFDKFASRIKELEFPKQERRWDLMTGTQFAFTIMSTIGKSGKFMMHNTQFLHGQSEETICPKAQQST